MATAKKGRDHERTNLDIWGDEDWLDVSPAAQHLYFVLKTSAKLTYCGAGEWHPGRIATRAKGWTAEAVEHAAAELSAAAAAADAVRKTIGVNPPVSAPVNLDVPGIPAQGGSLIDEVIRAATR